MSQSADRPFEIKVQGMHCGGCVKRVQSALEKLPGVVVDDVSIGAARGTFDPSEAPPSALVSALQAVGYSSELSTVEDTGDLG